MHTEYECTLLEVNESLEKVILENGGKKLGSYFQKRYTYDFNPVNPNKWIRLRTNGEKTTLTIKNLVKRDAIDRCQELEITVSDFENTNLILNELGYKAKNYQENKREIYILDNIEIDVDTWPLIPTYAEFEGDSEEAVREIILKLNLDQSKITTKDVQSIYKDIYGIDITCMKELKLEN